MDLKTHVYTKSPPKRLMEQEEEENEKKIWNNEVTQLNKMSDQVSSDVYSQSVVSQTRQHVCEIFTSTVYRFHPRHDEY